MKKRAWTRTSCPVSAFLDGRCSRGKPKIWQRRSPTSILLRYSVAIIHISADGVGKLKSRKGVLRPCDAAAWPLNARLAVVGKLRTGTGTRRRDHHRRISSHQQPSAARTGVAIVGKQNYGGGALRPRVQVRLSTSWVLAGESGAGYQAEAGAVLLEDDCALRMCP